MHLDQVEYSNLVVCEFSLSSLVLKVPNVLIIIVRNINAVSHKHPRVISSEMTVTVNTKIVVAFVDVVILDLDVIVDVRFVVSMEEL